MKQYKYKLVWTKDTVGAVYGPDIYSIYDDLNIAYRELEHCKNTYPKCDGFIELCDQDGKQISN